MALIYRNPLVEDYFAELDVSAVTSAVQAEAVNLYESGKVTLLKGVNIEADRVFLSTVEFPNDKVFKKFKASRFLSEWRAWRVWPETLLTAVFGGDKGRLKYFAEQVASVSDQLSRFRQQLFPGYVIEKDASTWRFSDTINENLHLDVYRDDIPSHHLRFFTNLDVVSRIWHTSHTLDRLLETSLHLLDPEFIRTASPGRICHNLNFAVFGGWDTAGVEGAPRHIAFFEPGDLWLVDSRLVSHQIFYERRAVSTEHPVAVSSMADPTKHYYAVVERYRSKIATAA